MTVTKPLRDLRAQRDAHRGVPLHPRDVARASVLLDDYRRTVDAALPALCDCADALEHVLAHEGAECDDSCDPPCRWSRARATLDRLREAMPS